MDALDAKKEARRQKALEALGRSDKQRAEPMLIAGYHAARPVSRCVLTHPEFDPTRSAPLAPWPLVRPDSTWSPFAGSSCFWWPRACSSMRPWTARDVDDVLFFGVLGVVLAGASAIASSTSPATTPNICWKCCRSEGRHVLPWRLVGRPVGAGLVLRRRGRGFFEVTDLVGPCVPTGIAAVRIGNFINGELWGGRLRLICPGRWSFRRRTMAWPGIRARSTRPWAKGCCSLSCCGSSRANRAPRGEQISGVFMVGYGVLRFSAEYFREPDDFFGLRALNWSQGQWLSLPMIVAGRRSLVGPPDAMQGQHEADLLRH